MVAPRTRRKMDERIAERQPTENAPDYGSEVEVNARTVEVNTKNKVAHSADGVVYRSTGGNVSVLGAAARRQAVYPLMLAGYSVQAIADRVGAAWETVRGDVNYLKATTLTRVDPELLRVASNEAMLEIQDIARERHRDGNVTEGRLAIDAWNRIAKTNSLEETATERETGGALAQLMQAMVRRVGGEVVEGLADGDDT